MGQKSIKREIDDLLEISQAKDRTKEELKKRIPALEDMAKMDLELVKIWEEEMGRSELDFVLAGAALSMIDSDSILMMELALYLGIGTPIMEEWLEGFRKMRREYLGAGLDPSCECLKCKKPTGEQLERPFFKMVEEERRRQHVFRL